MGAERTIHDLGGGSVLSFLGPSSDTTWYRGPGWQDLGPSDVLGHLLCPDDIEVVILAPHGQISDNLPIGCLIVVSDQAYHCCVVGKLNDGEEVVLGHSIMC